MRVISIASAAAALTDALVCVAECVSCERGAAWAVVRPAVATQSAAAGGPHLTNADEGASFSPTTSELQDER